MSYQTGKDNRMKITIEHYEQEYSATLYEGSDAREVQETFDRLLVQCGYPIDIRCADGGHFELNYVEEGDERV